MDLPVALIHVVGVRSVTPRVARITFTGETLGDLGFEAPDQQVKLCFPRPGQQVPRLPEPDPDSMRWYQSFLAIPEPERPWMRSFTIRAHHPRDRTVDIDFVLHGEEGPAGRWGAAAQVGDTLGMVGPQAIYSRALGAADWYLLAGDETALPAIATHLAALPETARALVFAEVADPAEEQPLPGHAAVTWVHRSAGGDLATAVRAAGFPPGSAFAWLAGEAGTVRTLRRHLIGDRGLDRRSIEFTGYWRARLTQDDAPTEEDLAEAREKIAAASLTEAEQAQAAEWVDGASPKTAASPEALGQ
ncbi:siderophore-interacting protein [Acrocarpospora catenulata]|uniref:siderophore-interacting protein n=1 Tax=Acrocarpospora catenulata TaxID=2836182 RepID=UPI001BD991FB|nr:siderophore-interacting protein [Acrocarpospora catenulata]